MPGRVAARSMAWFRRMGSVAGPLSASGEAVNDQPVQVEMYLQGAWTDITAYVMVRDNSGEISITRGRRDEGGTADHAVMNLLLNNRDGRWSPRNPAGAYYGYIGRNTPIRVSVPNGVGGKSYRFQGEVTAWPVGWDGTGTDVYVELEASGLLRRLSQAPPPAKSITYRAVTQPELTGLRAYWPCEDPKEALRIESALPTGSDMEFLLAPELAASEVFASSDPLPVFTNAAMTGGVPTYPDPTVSQVRFLLYVPPEGAPDLSLILRVTQLEDIALADAVHFELFYNAPGGAYTGVATPYALSLETKDINGSTIGSILHHTQDVRGRLLRISIELEESSTSVVQTVRILDLASGLVTSATQTTANEALTRVRRVAAFVNPFAPGSPDEAVGLIGGVMGHITVQDVITPLTDLGIRLSPVGETAGRRIERLCAEEGIAFESIGSLDDSVAMGGQVRNNSLDLMRECELADGGMLYETQNVLGVGYRPRSSLCNQTAQVTLDYEGFHLAEVPQPVEDDRYIQNKVTITVGTVSATYERTDGPLSTAQPPAGVGAYGEELTLNLANPGEASSQAAWRVHLGTVDEPRFPNIAVNLAHSSFTTNPALKQAILALRPGDRILVQNMPSWLPPGDVDQIILGVSEQITHFEHRLSFICAPASPYRSGELGAETARLDTDGSELRQSMGSATVNFDVIPSAGKNTMWTRDASDFPFDVIVGGEVMTVTSVTDYLTDTFARTSSNSWGSADTGQSYSTGGGTSTDYQVTGGYGAHVLATANASRRTFVSSTVTNFDVMVDVTTSATATGGFLSGGPVGRYIDSDNLYMGRLAFNTTNTITLSIRKRVLATETELGTYTLPDTYVAGTYYRIRFKADGSTFRAKAWLATDPETPEWQITTTDTAITTTSFIGLRSISASGNTNVNPEIRFQNYRIFNPQAFIVTRSVNGVVKSQTAGTDVRLLNPTILSL